MEGEGIDVPVYYRSFCGWPGGKMCCDLTAWCGREQFLTSAQEVGLCVAWLPGEAELLLVWMEAPVPPHTRVTGVPRRSWAVEDLESPFHTFLPLITVERKRFVWGSCGRAKVMGQEPTMKIDTCKTYWVNMELHTWAICHPFTILQALANSHSGWPLLLIFTIFYSRKLKRGLNLTMAGLHPGRIAKTKTPSLRHIPKELRLTWGPDASSSKCGNNISGC